jgi:quercetin dioxygenase-like cupin family protein
MRDIMGPMILSDANPSEEKDFSVIRSLMPSGTLVPVHSHADREVCVVVEGVLSVWLDGAWHEVHPGDCIGIPPDARHSLFNGCGREIAMMLITTPLMRRFFDAVSVPAAEVSGPPDAERIGKFVTLALQHGFWLGSPEDQARIGMP